MGQPLLNEIGDAEAMLAAAPHKVDHVYRTPRHNHNAIEPHAATIIWNGDELTIHDTTQMVTAQAATIADIFWPQGRAGARDLALCRRRLRLQGPGGPPDPGRRGGKTDWATRARDAVARRRVPDRRRPHADRAASRDRRAGGRPFQCADPHRHRGDDGPQQHARAFITATRSGYAADSFRLSVETVTMNMLANIFMRAPGESVGTFALESAIDELAIELGMDPIELRIRNEPDKDPTSGLPFSSRHIVEAWRSGAERFGWDRRSAVPGARREGEWLVGMGCATATYPYRMPGAAARITLARDGTALVEVAAHEMGMGTATTTAIVAADRLGLPLDRVEVRYGDSIIPGAILAGGSQQTAAIGGAVIAAHRALVAELLKLAGNDSPLAGLSVDEVGARMAALPSSASPPGAKATPPSLSVPSAIA